MSCTAIAKWTCAIRPRSVFCGTLNIGPKSADSCTSGKSSAGIVCSVKRLLPPASVSLDCVADSVTVWSDGIERRMSISFRAPDRGREVARVAAELGARAHLDLEVAGRELDRAAGLADEHVGEDRQRVPTLDDSRDGLQRTQEFFLCCFQDNHVNLLNWS